MIRQVASLFRATLGDSEEILPDGFSEGLFQEGCEVGVHGSLRTHAFPSSNILLRTSIDAIAFTFPPPNTSTT